MDWEAVWCSGEDYSPWSWKWNWILDIRPRTNCLISESLSFIIYNMGIVISTCGALEGSLMINNIRYLHQTWQPSRHPENCNCDYYGDDDVMVSFMCQLG